jgi:hypothetical protein
MHLKKKTDFSPKIAITVNLRKLGVGRVMCSYRTNLSSVAHQKLGIINNIGICFKMCMVVISRLQGTLHLCLVLRFNMRYLTEFGQYINIAKGQLSINIHNLIYFVTCLTCC